jgi:hypothetical protein
MKSERAEIAGTKLGLHDLARSCLPCTSEACNE